MVVFVFDSGRYLTPTPLREALERLSLSQTQLARKLAIDRKAVVRWVAGDHTPQPSRREQIAAVLNAEGGLGVTAQGLWPHAYPERDAA